MDVSEREEEMGFLSARNVMLDQHANSKDEVLHDLAAKAVKLGIADDADAVYDSFIFREGLGPTGLTDGFAIPHAKCAAIKEASIIVYENDKALEWPSFDDKPIDIAIALLVPDAQAGTTHLKLLSKTAVLLMNDDFKHLVRSTTNKEDIATAINYELEHDDE